jgi:Tol biopolymer transport system component
MSPQKNEERLNSWKEIGAYLQRNEATVRRWEKREALPVHRHTHESRSSVYAYRSEIDAWRAGRKMTAEPARVRAFWRVPAFALTVMLCLIMVGNGVRPQAASAQQSDGARMRQVPFESGYEAPSSDGRYLTFTDWSTGDLAVRDLSTGAKRRLTDHGGWDKTAGHADESSLISPDGRQVAYVFFDPKPNRAELRLVPFTGGDPRYPKILHRSEETRYILIDGWTPDGKSILVTRELTDGTSQLAMISIEDGSLRVLKSFGWKTLGGAALSPDGLYVAYGGAESETDWDIFVLASDGSRQGKLTQGPAIDSSPMWSPDGSQVLFFSDRTGASQSMWTVAVNGGKASGPARLVKGDFGSGRFFPRGMTRDGAFYFFTGSERTNIYTAEFDANLKTLKAPELVPERFVDSTGGGSWSPSGELLAYYAFRAPSQAVPGGTDLILRTLKTGTERIVRMPQLIVPPYLYTPPPRWFPDGQSVMVVSYGRKRPGLAFYRVDLTTGNAELLQEAQDAGPSDLSPDGRTIFYRDGVAATGMRIVSFDLDAKRETELKRISMGKSLTPIVVSPDGKQLAYGVMDHPKGTVAAVSSLEVISSSGGQAHQVFHGKIGPQLLAWSRDQNSLFFAQPGVGWSRIPITGGDPEKIGLAQAGSGRQVFFPLFHPDGRDIIFGSVEESKQQFWALENFLPKPKGK